MKQWEELIRENVFGLGGHRDHLPACLAHMLYCVVAEEQYNLAYFFVKRIECARANPTANLPYGPQDFPVMLQHMPTITKPDYCCTKLMTTEAQPIIAILAVILPWTDVVKPATSKSDKNQRYVIP
ncbi:hypothetical protein Tco_0267861 [Tanacetum coccineum]